MRAGTRFHYLPYRHKAWHINIQLIQNFQPQERERCTFPGMFTAYFHCLMNQIRKKTHMYLYITLAWSFVDQRGENIKCRSENKSPGQGDELQILVPEAAINFSFYPARSPVPHL